MAFQKGTSQASRIFKITNSIFSGLEKQTQGFNRSKSVNYFSSKGGWCQITDSMTTSSFLFCLVFPERDLGTGISPPLRPPPPSSGSQSTNWLNEGKVSYMIRWGSTDKRQLQRLSRHYTMSMYTHSTTIQSLQQ